MYNGHKNWNHWNVSLWLNNNEGTYRTMVDLCRRMNRKKAAEQMLSFLGGPGSKTPDGAPYTITSIQAAMRGI